MFDGWYTAASGGKKVTENLVVTGNITLYAQYIIDRYATEEVSTDAKKQARFRKGLSPELRRDLRLHECTFFSKLVNKAISAETGQTDYDATRKHGRDMGSSSGAGPQKRRVWVRDMGSSSGAGPQKRRVWVPNTALPPRFTPRPSFQAPRPVQQSAPTKPYGGPTNNAPPRTSSVTCFKCGESGHYMREFTPRPSFQAPRPVQQSAPAKPYGGPTNHAPPRTSSVTCFKCGESGHYMRECPQTNPNQSAKAVGRGKPTGKVFHAKPVIASRGHVNCISAEEAQEDPNVVLGTLLVNCHPASVLFDTGALC